MSKGKKSQRFYYGIITGIFMFGAYFLLDMLFAIMYDGQVPFKENLLFYFMMTFVLGFIAAQIFLWKYKKTVRKLGSVN